MKKIIIDTLGSDFGFTPIVSGILKAMESIPDTGVIFIGNKEEINKIIDKSSVDKARIEIIHTEQYVPDDAIPTCVFRGCDDTSMVISLEKLKSDDDIIGMISSGNTGALLVGTICRLGLIDGLKSPALATALPCKKDGLVCLVDCGANTDCTATDMKNFALLGNAFMQSICALPSPKIALMNVGEARHKGTQLQKEAYELLESLPINFIGNIEGSHLINSPADVIVTDGFTGNILLKNTEACGVAAIKIIDQCTGKCDITENIKKNLHDFFVFNDLGGAIFLGTKKAVIKMHGAANENTAFNCIKMLLDLERSNYREKIASSLK